MEKNPSVNTDAAASLGSHFYSAKSIHNDFLDVQFTAIENEELSVGNTSEFLSLSTDYFINTVGYSQTSVEELNDGVEDILALQGDIQTNLESVISTDEGANSLYSWILLQSNNWSASPTTFESALLAKLSDIENNPDLTSEQKQSYASILGASAGSYEYWHTNIEAWRQLINPSSDPGITGGKWIDFFMRDCAGATWGGIYGSAVPGLGTVAGGVGGAAIMSGLEAMSW